MDRERLLDAARALQADAAGRDVIAMLGAAGMRPLLLRGPALAAALYDPAELRAYRDSDLIVAPADIDAAREVLRACGMQRVLEGAHPHEQTPQGEKWIWPERSAVIDLHWSLVGVTVADPWPVFDAHRAPLDLAGTSVAGPDAPLLALIVALHAAAHGDARTLEDLERAVARLDAATWAVAADLARRLGAAGAMRVGLERAADGSALAQTLGIADAPARPATALAAAGAPRGSLSVAALAADPARRTPRALARKLVPTPASLRARSALARRGRLGLVAAYGQRLVMAPVWAVRGVRAWRRVR